MRRRLLLVVMMLGFGVSLLSLGGVVSAEVLRPGCYTYINGRYEADGNCQAIKTLNPNFNQTTGKCYVIQSLGSAYGPPQEMNNCDTTKGVTPVNVPPASPGLTPSNPKEPGCYMQLTQTRGELGQTVTVKQWTSYSCASLGQIYPDYNFDPAKCYFFWPTIFGPTIPKEYPCQTPPPDNASLEQGQYANTNVAAVDPDRQKVEEACSDKNNLQRCFAENPIIQYVQMFVNVLSGAVGIIVVIMVIVGGIQYSSAGGNPQAVAAAKKRIINAILALVALIFMYAFLQWLVPGGVF